MKKRGSRHLSHPAVGKALWRETLVEASIFREALLNIGRRDARTRVAHFLCEISLRLEAAGLAAADHFELPVTQEQLGDLLGLTSVHVNRTLRALREDKVIGRIDRLIVILDLRRLMDVGDFDSTYLHLNGAAPESRGVAAYGLGFDER